MSSGSSRPLPEPALLGGVFRERYEIVSRLGLGSFGRVYKARQLSTGQDVAIKMLRVGEDDSAAFVESQTERFRREMRLCAGLWHPNIVRLLDSGESEDGVLYAVLEYVPGATLRGVLDAEGKLDVAETLHLMTQVLDALSCAHARGVVHRDLKPDNILVTRTGARRNALVLDFGLGGFTPEARGWTLPHITATQEMMGTPCYAAPEQLRGEPPSTRSDLYSWGLILLECLTGEIAVGGSSAPDVILKQLGPDPIPIPSWLRQQRLGRLLEVVTAKEIERRDVAVEGLLEELSVIQRGAMPSIAGTTRQEPLAAAERRQLTVLSCRLTVSPVGGRVLDLEELDELLHAGQALAAELAGRSGGQVANVLADRIVVVFGHPQAREDDARRAARVARDIAAEATRWSERLESERRLRLTVRTGVHTGLVIVRELQQATRHRLYDLVGLTPEVATRLEERAGTGEVLVSGDTHRLLRGEFATEPAGELQLPEHAGAIRLFRLIGDETGRGAETIPWVRETPLVGRTHELRRVLDVWEQAQAGRPGAVLIDGEPGIGKSRLVRELRRRVRPDGWLEGRCVAEHQHSPLRPIVELLLSVNDSIEPLLAHHGFDLAETLPLFAALLSQPLPPGYAPLQLMPDRQKELTLSVVLSLFLKIAQERPLLLALEDLQWADPTTLELAAALVQEARTAHAVASEPPPRVCFLFTARPEFTPPWPRDDTCAVQLSRLAREEVVEMVTAGLSMGTTLPPALLDLVVRRSDGVPLFVEEVTRVLLESGALAEDAGESRSDEHTFEIPGTLRDLLTARLDRLSFSARETIQLAAVLGREFLYDLLRALAGKDESVVRADVRELLAAGLLHARRSARRETYVFKHTLIRDAAYESMTRPARRSLHERVGRTLRERFPDVEESRPEVLAQHFEKAGDSETAATYSHRAGEHALARAAYAEATQHLERGLALLGTVPASPRRSRQEVELLTALGTAFLSTKGFAAEEVGRTFAHARRLCEDLAEDIPLKVLGGIFGVQITRGDREAVGEILPYFRRLADRGEDAAACFAGHQVLGIHAFWSGDFPAAREHTAAGMRLYGSEAVQSLAWEYGYGLFCHAYGMSSLFQLGHPDQAEALRREMTAIAERSRHPYCMTIALGFGTTLTHDRGCPEATLELADRLIVLGTEQHLLFWSAIALCARGWARMERGETEAAIEQVRQGLALLQAIGARSSYCYYLTYLAETCLGAGQLDEGLAVVVESLSLCETLGARFHEADLWRLRGELLHRRGDAGAAENALQRALDVARRQQGRSFELRAATVLARLFGEQGRTAEARSLLGDVYGWFTEGLETRDLRAARALLAELR